MLSGAFRDLRQESYKTVHLKIGALRDLSALEEQLRENGGYYGGDLQSLEIVYGEGDLRRWQPEQHQSLLSMLRTLFQVERRIKRLALRAGETEDGHEPQIFLPLEVLHILLSGAGSLQTIQMTCVSFVCSSGDKYQHVLELLQTQDKSQSLKLFQLRESGLVLLDHPNAIPEESTPLDIVGLGALFQTASSSIEDIRMSGDAHLVVKVPSLNEWKCILATLQPSLFLEAFLSPNIRLEYLSMNFKSVELSHWEMVARYLQGSPTATVLTIRTRNIPANMEETRKIAALLAEALKMNARRPCPLKQLDICSCLFPRQRRMSPTTNPERFSQYKEVLECFAQALMHHTRLHYFCLPSSLRNSDAGRNILMYTELNGNGRHELLNEGGSFRRNWYNALHRYGDDADRLFCLLRANPSLWLAHVAY